MQRVLVGDRCKSRWCRFHCRSRPFLAEFKANDMFTRSHVGVCLGYVFSAANGNDGVKRESAGMPRVLK